MMTIEMREWTNTLFIVAATVMTIYMGISL